MPDNCRHWQGLLAEHFLAKSGPHGNADDTMDHDLADHVAGCAECRAAAAEFRSTTAALAHATAPGADRIANPESSGLVTRIAARVDQERFRRDRRRRFAVVAGAVAAAIVVVVAVVVVRQPASTDTLGERVALTAAGMHGDATLQARAWGTEIRLAASGFTPGQQYNVWLERADGSRVAAGTFVGVRDSQIAIVLASALPSSQATAIGISEPDGRLVVRAPLD